MTKYTEDAPFGGDADYTARVLDRFATKFTVADSGCWTWTASRDTRGYGQMKVHGRHHRAHRISYEIANGPVPDGLEVDHLCGNMHCVNPDHLEAVTHRENVLRSTGPAAINARKDHCPQGHELAGDNLVAATLSRGVRNCRTCWNESARKRYAAKRGARPARGTVTIKSEGVK